MPIGPTISRTGAAAKPRCGKARAASSSSCGRRLWARRRVGSMMTLDRQTIVRSSAEREAAAQAYHRGDAHPLGRMKRLVVLLALVSMTALAAPPASGTVYLEDMTWTEVRDAIAAGRTTIIVPVGGTEQSGPHMALGKHNVRAHVLAGRIAEQLGNALVAPVIASVPEGRIDPPTGHMKFAGTISVSSDAFKGVLEGAARSFRQAGFRDIVLIGDHGGYQAQLQAVAAKLDREWAGAPARVHFIAEYYRATDAAYVQA